jgi:chromosome segregation ATPase
LHPVQESFNAQSKRLELENEIVQLRLTHEAQTKMLEESNQQLQQSTSSLLKVSTALEQVSAFKNDIAHNWTALMHQQQERIQALETALRDSESNNAKKSAELHAMDLLRARLENDLQHTREELQRQKNKPRWKR